MGITGLGAVGAAASGLGATAATEVAVSGFTLLGIQVGSRIVAAALGGAAIITGGTALYFAYKASWKRKEAKDEMARKMKQEMRNRVLTYVGIAQRSFRKLGNNKKWYALSKN
jgi:hypothetical protein